MAILRRKKPDSYQPSTKPAFKKSGCQLDAEIAEALAKPVGALSRRHHATVAAPSPKRWNHRKIARGYLVAEDVVRRIYAAVQTAKRQGLYAGHLADLIERSVDRNLSGAEYTVASLAREHLGYDLPSGYGGPKPKGSAKEPPRSQAGPKTETAAQIAGRANTSIKEVLDRRRDARFGWDETNDASDRERLRHAADELDVAADLYEEASAGVRAGTLHERAKLARRGDYRRLDVYD